MSQCASLGGGWRLPTLAELLSLASSPYVGSAGFAWAVFFTDGSTVAMNTTNFGENYIRCVL